MIELSLVLLEPSAIDPRAVSRDPDARSVQHLRMVHQQELRGHGSDPRRIRCADEVHKPFPVDASVVVQRHDELTSRVCQGLLHADIGASRVV